MAGLNPTSMQGVASLVDQVFAAHHGPESSREELSFYSLHLFPSLDSIYDLNPPIPVTNKAYADFVRYREDVSLQDVGRTVNILPETHGKQAVFNVRLEHIANGELQELIQKIGLRFPPSF